MDSEGCGESQRGYQKRVIFLFLFAYSTERGKQKQWREGLLIGEVAPPAEE